jgi:hypothetical protein
MLSNGPETARRMNLKIALIAECKSSENARPYTGHGREDFFCNHFLFVENLFALDEPRARRLRPCDRNLQSGHQLRNGVSSIAVLHRKERAFLTRKSHAYTARRKPIRQKTRKNTLR